jgi:hypothetical protein
MFDRAGHDISMIQKVVGPTAQVLTSARAAGIKIIYLKMGFRPDLSDLGDPDSPNHIFLAGVGETVRAPNGTEGRILVRDTWNTDEVVGQDLPRSNHEATLWLVQGRFGWVSDSDTFIGSELTGIAIQNLGMTPSLVLGSLIGLVAVGLVLLIRRPAPFASRGSAVELA